MEPGELRARRDLSKSDARSIPVPGAVALLGIPGGQSGIVIPWENGICFFLFIQQRAWLLHLLPCLELFMGICPPQVCQGHRVVSCRDFQTSPPRTRTFLYPDLTVYKAERCRAELVDSQALSSRASPLPSSHKWPPKGVPGPLSGLSKTQLGTDCICENMDLGFVHSLLSHQANQIKV